MADYAKDVLVETDWVEEHLDDPSIRIVEVDENPDSRLTVVLAHGFTARLAEWELQREVLRPRARLVLFDQRGHGRSGWTKLTKATIDRTGRDLGEVLDTTTPEGPVVLAGHSMGGMSVMALARQRPELFGTRVVGVFLLATSAGGLVESGLVGRAVKLVRRLGLLSLYLWLLQVTAPRAQARRVAAQLQSDPGIAAALPPQSGRGGDALIEAMPAAVVFPSFS